MRRLSSKVLNDLPARMRRPAYDRARLAIGMAHIGVGAFHRCHQAEFTDDMLEARFGAWGVLGVNLREPRLGEILAPQDGLFTRTLRQDQRSETRVIGSILKAIDVENAATSAAAIDGLAAPEIGVVTMTITEKGYCHIPATGQLDVDHVGVRADLSADEGDAAPPATALGLLARVCERRKALHAPGLTLISCDNIPSNGQLLRDVLLGFAASRSAPLARWIETMVAFPCSMVDRIVPAATEDDRAAVADSIGARDEAAAIGEPFRQWVIEDGFAGSKPPWDLAGAQFVRDARPYELVKMRLLNAAQSNLSHLGALVGHTFSFEAAADPVLAAATRRMLERETSSTLPAVDGMATGAYIDSTFQRIGNSAIRHRCHQISADGSQKIIQRIVNPLRERLHARRGTDFLVLALSGWLAYVFAGSQRFGARWAPSDPWAAALIDLADEAGGDFEGLAKAVLELAPLFGSDLAAPSLVRNVAAHLRALLSSEPRAYVANLLRDG
jgi:fructuronate reductase